MEAGTTREICVLSPELPCPRILLPELGALKFDYNAKMVKTIEMLENVPLFLRVLAALILLMSAAISLAATRNKYKTWKSRKLLVENEYAEKFLGQFNQKEIDSFISGYVIPQCAPSDPTNKEGEEHLADIQESIFSFMDRNVALPQRSYHLILADTGMGKTMFCLNYLSHAKRKTPDLNFCLVSLSSKSADQQISRVINKSETVLIADALDEDPNGLSRGRERLMEVLEGAADFKTVIITCRSQYFLSDDAIPRETPLPILVPRQIGQSPTFTLVRSYIAPFGKYEIRRYLNRHFPFWAIWRLASRRQAQKLIEAVPDLVHRPMLLERLPELAKEPTKSNELYELYDLLVEGWLTRESRWFNLEALRRISLELAIVMYRQFESRQGRTTRDEVVDLATKLLGESPDWKHLTARSLLNRDSRGNFKFAHKSILEFLVVKAAIAGDDRSLESAWTPFMKEIFISWGHSDSSEGSALRANAILSSEEGRKNIAPLFDMLGTTAVSGIPNFKRAFERKFTSTGDRFAPAKWRHSSLAIVEQDLSGVYSIFDHEFNLEWEFISTVDDPEIRELNLLEAIKLDVNNDSYKLPSLEQFLTLIEGLFRIGEFIIPYRKMFLLEDKPGRNLHLLIHLNSEPITAPHLKLVDKMHFLSGTNISMNSYVTGASYSPDYGIRTIVGQLRLRDRLSRLI